MKRRVASNPPRELAARVGEEAAAGYSALYGAIRALGGLGMEWLAPNEAVELDGMFRPGFVVFASDGAGDHLAWDVRKGPPERGSLPMIRWIDHEVGLGAPYARDLSGALCHLAVQRTVGLVGAEAAASLKRACETFARAIRVDDQRTMASLIRKLDRAGTRVGLEGWKAGERAARPFIPKAATVWAGLPLTHLPLLDPTDHVELRDKAERYADSAAEYRRMVHDEGRRAYAWYLAAALLGLADVEIRRRRLSHAAKAAKEAMGHYRALYEAGELRCETQLAFCHRTLSLDAKRRKDRGAALTHAEQALDLLDSAVQSASSMVVALGHVARAWEQERAGDPGDQVRPLLGTAARLTSDLVSRQPPHPYRDDAARIARLAMAPKKTGASRRRAP